MQTQRHFAESTLFVNKGFYYLPEIQVNFKKTASSKHFPQLKPMQDMLSTWPKMMK